MPQPRDDIIKAYRKGETQPLSLNAVDIISLLKGINIAKNVGMPAIGANNLGDKILLEGRSDAGVNEFNTNNASAQSLYNTVRTQLPDSVSNLGATYAAAVLDKSQVASRLGIPFEQAWNGTGVSKETGRSGSQHADRAAQMQGAIDDPRNSQLKDLITRGIAGDFTPKEDALVSDWSAPAKQLAGTNNLTQNGVYTKEAKDGVTNSLVLATDNLPYARSSKVFDELGSDLITRISALGQVASGLSTRNTDSQSKFLAGLSPDSMNTLDSLLNGGLTTQKQTHRGIAPNLAVSPAPIQSSDNTSGFFDSLLTRLTNLGN